MPSAAESPGNQEDSTRPPGDKGLCGARGEGSGHSRGGLPRSPGLLHQHHRLGGYGLARSHGPQPLRRPELDGDGRGSTPAQPAMASTNGGPVAGKPGRLADAVDVDVHDAPARGDPRRIEASMSREFMPSVCGDVSGNRPLCRRRNGAEDRVRTRRAPPRLRPSGRAGPNGGGSSPAYHQGPPLHQAVYVVPYAQPVRHLSTASARTRSSGRVIFTFSGSPSTTLTLSPHPPSGRCRPCGTHRPSRQPSGELGKRVREERLGVCAQKRESLGTVLATNPPLTSFRVSVSERHGMQPSAPSSPRSHRWISFGGARGLAPSCTRTVPEGFAWRRPDRTDSLAGCPRPGRRSPP